VNRVFIVDKPSGLTSHDVVARLRRALRIRRVGHAGTLDPSATGVLIVLVGKATRLAQFFMDCRKRYRGTIVLGASTDTQDAQGKVLKVRPVGDVTEERIREVFRGFEGEIEQVPPMVSALKHQGTPLYVLARRGETVERAARRVTIGALRLLAMEVPELEFEVECSRGTYVRTLANDIGEELSTGAHLNVLARTAVGPFELKDAVRLQEIENDAGRAEELGLTMFDALPFLPDVRLSEREIDRIAMGGPVELDAGRFSGLDGRLVRVTSDGKELVAVARGVSSDPDRSLSGPDAADALPRGELRPVKVFAEL
jgi:tRNA pseudouridine55 synthase